MQHLQLSDGSGDARTDTMIIVSINREAQTASMVSLPRDLYVYMPNRIMGRLNTAVNLGGVELLEQTILYNFGIPIHYHAQVDFDGFKQIVDLLGGVSMAVSCPLEEWRLLSPELDPTLEENWGRFKLEAGMHQMDGDLALWYARSRLTTTDFDRGRRQQPQAKVKRTRTFHAPAAEFATSPPFVFHEIHGRRTGRHPQYR